MPAQRTKENHWIVRIARIVARIVLRESCGRHDCTEFWTDGPLAVVDRVGAAEGVGLHLRNFCQRLCRCVHAVLVHRIPSKRLRIYTRHPAKCRDRS
jgi:hypothetical protein